jgi:predicted PP-loop superfamily ATPase
MDDYPQTMQERTHEASRDNSHAEHERESAEEHGNDDDSQEIALAISLSISQAAPVLTIQELALEITKGIYDWSGDQVENLQKLARELKDQAGEVENAENLCGKPHNNGEETCGECQAIKHNI